MVLFNSAAFKKRHNVPANDGLTLKEISTLSKMPIKALREVYKKRRRSVSHQSLIG